MVAGGRYTLKRSPKPRNFTSLAAHTTAVAISGNTCRRTDVAPYENSIGIQKGFSFLTKSRWLPLKSKSFILSPLSSIHPVS
jgi:hypothetical protein